MRLRPTAFRTSCFALRSGRAGWPARRCLMTLAIETSCDDSSVAILEKHTQHGQTTAELHFHKTVTSDNRAFKGVHPVVSLVSHQENLATLVNEAVRHLPAKDGRDDGDSAQPCNITLKKLPDFISVTRGPGMRANLFVGLDIAKGLAVAWQKPLVGVHHMQAHALTPRLVSALEPSPPSSLEPDFPFLSVLASGGHTLLVHSASLTDHSVLCSTVDIAIGDCLDKIARVVLPPALLQSIESTMYGSLLERFAFPETHAVHEADVKTSNITSAPPQVHTNQLMKAAGNSAEKYMEQSRHQYGWYEVASNHEKAAEKSMTKWGWGFTQPLIKSGGGNEIKSLKLSFTGLLTAAERIVRYGGDPCTKKLSKVERDTNSVSLDERQDIARESMRTAFEHVAHRVILGMQSVSTSSAPPNAVVLSGGVAANSFLRHILASTLCAHGYGHVKLYFPPPKYCTDNAAMIAWAGLEMFEAGHLDPLSIRAIQRWPLDILLNPSETG